MLIHLTLIVSILLLFSQTIFAEKALVNVKSTLVVREKPNKNSSKLSNIPSKAIVDTKGTDLDEDSNRWFQISYKGKSGWVFGEFLDFNLGKAKKQVAEGTFVDAEMGDYFHVTFKIKAEEKSFFVTQNPKGFEIVKLEESPKKYKNKKFKITWVSEKVFIPEAGGFDIIDNIIKLELVNK